MPELEPITREEKFLNGEVGMTPITREEKILAGEDDFYVLTRREYFLKRYRGSQIEVVPYEATANGTYTAPQGKAYSPFTVNVPTTPTEELNATANGEYYPSTGKVFSKVTVAIADGTNTQY